MDNEEIMRWMKYGQNLDVPVVLGRNVCSWSESVYGQNLDALVVLGRNGCS